jgi:hypothetical protein
MREAAMKGLRRRGFLAGLCGAVLAAGCNFPTAMYFLFPENKEPAEYRRLASEDPKKEVTVVLWTYMGLDLRPETAQFDRALTEALARHIRQMTEENREKVTLVKPRLVEEYKNTHPDWKGLDPEQVGRYFKADYVISLEIDQLSLYEPNANQQLYRGRAHLLVSLVDVKNPDENPQPHEFSDLFPGDLRGGEDASDMPVMQFRQKFVEHIARRLSFYFVNHPKHDRVMVMDG